MNNKMSKTVVVGVIVVLLLSLGVVAAFAQDDTTTDVPTTPALPFGRGFGGHHGFGHFGDGDNDRQAELAAALGITVEELEAAQQKVFAENLAQAVEDGALTQDQANTMLAMHALKSYIDREAMMAEALGLTADELATAIEDGTLYDLLANITPADLQAKMQAAMETAVAQAVADNVITQEQADLVLAQLANGLGMMGGRHGFGGGRGGFHGQGMAPRFDSAETTVTPFGV